MRIRTTGTAALTAAAVVAALAGCGGSKSHDAAARPSSPASGVSTSPSPSGASGVSGTPSATATASPTTPATTPPPSGKPTVVESTSSAKLGPALLTLANLPSGFHSRPLTARNLPSLIHGCPGLEELQTTGIGDQAQAEWSKGPLDAYIDEAVIQPRHDTAAGLVDKSAKALDACGSVQVVEEGLAVKLTATRLPLAKVGDASHAWHTTGRYAGVPMEMNVVLVQAGNLVVLVAQTHIAGRTDDALTLQATQAAVANAMAFQKSA